MTRATWLVGLLLGAGALHAAPPPDGLAAEQREDWSAAAASYRAHLAGEPVDVETWRRLSDVEARRGEPGKAAEALGHAAEVLPADAELQAEHSRALATAQDKVGALAAIERALVLEPDRAEFLLARARLAGWNGDYALAERSLARVEAQDPSQPGLLADKARLRAWRGRNAEAAKLFERHLAAAPDDREAALDLIRVETWRGDYAAAIDALDAYDERHGRSDDSDALRARSLAWAGRRDEGEALNQELRVRAHDPYASAYTETLLQRTSHVPRTAEPFLEEVRALQAGSDETLDLERSTRLAWRSRLWVDYGIFRDSDSIEVPQLSVGGSWTIGERLRLLADVGRRSFDADAGSGLEAPQGEVDERRARIGARYAVSRDLAAELMVGRSNFEDIGATGIGTLALDWRASDDFNARLSAERDRVGISPRAASLGLARNGISAQGTFTPGLRWRITGELRGDGYSDGNDRREASLAASRSYWRGDRWNVDLGAGAWWFGFDEDLDNGYYDPSSYRRLQAFALAYLKISDDHGINFHAAAGVQKDETLDAWKGAYDFALEGTFGIFADWRLKVRAAYTDRRQAAGGFDGRSFGANLEYRF